MNEKLSEKPLGEIVPISTPENQIQEPFEVPPEYQEDYGNDPALYTIGAEYTEQSKWIQRVSGLPVLQGGGIGLNWALKNTNPQVGNNFQAHGIAKGIPWEGLHKILTQGVHQGQHLYSMPFIAFSKGAGAFGAAHPFTTGGIILVANHGKRFQEEGGRIEYIILDERFHRLIDLMQKKYPHVKFVPWHDAPKILTQAHNRATNENIKYTEIDNENPPRYLHPDVRWRSWRFGTVADIPPTPKGEYNGGDDEFDF